MSRHQITRVRRETRRRTLTLSSTARLTPNMLRLGFTSDDLKDFDSASPDDHIKLFFPEAGTNADGKPAMRDYTPRSFDTGRGELTIDFAIHAAGPATEWALSAKVGDTLEIGGPRGSAVVPDDFDWYLLIGDETALPAIGRRIEELRADVPVTSLVIVPDAADAQTFTTKADWTGQWVVRGDAPDDIPLLLDALANITLPEGEGFVWIAAEGTVARAARGYVVDTLGHPREWTKAAGYWLRGEANAHGKIED